jgi:shikimate kinase
MILRLKRTPGVYLAGFMASGKTTIGRLLAERLGWYFADLDADIEAAQNCSIAEIFDLRGEDEFRRVETEALERRVHAVERGTPTVVALGGGTFVQNSNFQLLENNGVTIWLDAPLEIIRRRVGQSAHRPLAREASGLEELYHSRRQPYSRADFRIEIDGDDPATVVDAILQLPLFR